MFSFDIPAFANDTSIKISVTLLDLKHAVKRKFSGRQLYQHLVKRALALKEIIWNKEVHQPDFLYVAHF